MRIFSGSLFQGRVAESTMGDKWAVGSKQGSRDILYVCNSSCRYEGAELCSALMV